MALPPEVGNFVAISISNGRVEGDRGQISSNCIKIKRVRLGERIKEVRRIDLEFATRISNTVVDSMLLGYRDRGGIGATAFDGSKDNDRVGAGGSLDEESDFRRDEGSFNAIVDGPRPGKMEIGSSPIGGKDALIILVDDKIFPGGGIGNGGVEHDDEKDGYSRVSFLTLVMR